MPPVCRRDDDSVDIQKSLKTLSEPPEMAAVIFVILVESEHEGQAGIDHGRDACRLDHSDEPVGRQMRCLARMVVVQLQQLITSWRVALQHLDGWGHSLSSIGG